MNKRGASSGRSTHLSAVSQGLETYHSTAPIASWIFGSVLLIFLIVVVFFLPNPTPFQQSTIRFLMALAAAFFALFFVGGVLLKGTLGGLFISATGGFALFILIQFVFDPFKVLASPAPAQPPTPTASPISTTSPGGPSAGPDVVPAEINSISKAAEQLGKPDIQSRINGILALERLDKETKTDHWLIVETLVTFIRNNAAWKGGTDRPAEQIPGDIQTALSVLARRTRTYEKGETQKIDLGGTDLRGVVLRFEGQDGARFNGIRLENAHLEKANLQRAQFAKAILKDANFDGAVLYGADLTGADLNGTSLNGTDLQGVVGLDWNTQIKGMAFIDNKTKFSPELERKRGK